MATSRAVIALFLAATLISCSQTHDPLAPKQDINSGEISNDIFETLLNDEFDAKLKAEEYLWQQREQAPYTNELAEKNSTEEVTSANETKSTDQTKWVYETNSTDETKSAHETKFGREIVHPTESLHKGRTNTRTKTGGDKDASEYERKFFNEFDYEYYDDGTNGRKHGKAQMKMKTTPRVLVTPKNVETWKDIETPKDIVTTPRISLVHAEDAKQTTTKKSTTTTTKKPTVKPTAKVGVEMCKNATLRDKCISTGGHLGRKDMRSYIRELLQIQPCKVWTKIQGCLDAEAKCQKSYIEDEKKRFEKEHQVVCSSAMKLFCSTIFFWHAVFWLRIFG